MAAIAWDLHPDWLLVVAGNRDEFHTRPTAPLAAWPEASENALKDQTRIIAGTDLTGGGTWLGVTQPRALEPGRFALVTNYRVPEGAQPGRPSRGRLVTDLLAGESPDERVGSMAQMNPFNLILAEGGQAHFLTNHPGVDVRPLERSIHGLSNGGFDVPWPKTLRVCSAVENWLTAGDPNFAPLLMALRDETPAPMPASPELGPEQRFAPVFIRDDVYGTRCSTVITVDRQGRGTILERSFDPQGRDNGEVRISFEWPRL